MVTTFSGTSILSNEFVVIGRASTDNLGVIWVRAPNVAHGVTGGKKWLKKPKSERDEMELRSFWCGQTSKSDKNGQVMATQRFAKSGRAANFETISGYFSHIF